MEKPQSLEVGDEVIGDEHIFGRIVRITEICGSPQAGLAVGTREYLTRTEKGERFLYTGETNLRLVRRGIGDAAPPDPQTLIELEHDLRTRPLAGIRIDHPN